MLVGSVVSRPQEDADVVAFLIGGNDVLPVAMRRTDGLAVEKKPGQVRFRYQGFLSSVCIRRWREAL